MLQCTYFFIDFSSDEIVINQTEFQQFQNEIDSLRFAKIENNKPKIYPFNPNFITDYKENRIGETGTLVKQGFEYNSGNNEDWLTHEQFLEMADEYL